MEARRRETTKKVTAATEKVGSWKDAGDKKCNSTAGDGGAHTHTNQVPVHAHRRLGWSQKQATCRCLARVRGLDV